MEGVQMVTVLGIPMPLHELLALIKRDVRNRPTCEGNEIEEGVYLGVCNSCSEKEIFAGYSDKNSNMKTWINQCDKEHDPQEEKERSLGCYFLCNKCFELDKDWCEICNPTSKPSMWTMKN